MKIKPFSDDLYSILTKAGSLSKKYYHTWCGTPHLFMSLVAFLNQNKDSARYKNTTEKFKEILSKHGLSGKLFEKSFLDINPVGVAPKEDEEFVVKTDREFDKVKDGLLRILQDIKKTTEVEDLIAELFSDKSFNLYSIISSALQADAKSDALANEMVSTFKRNIASMDTALDQIKELTNINDYVRNNPQVVIGVDKLINELMVTLNARVVKNPILVGPAGAGKTVLVYELAQRINAGNVPASLKNKRIYQLDPANLISGSRYRGKQNCLS